MAFGKGCHLHLIDGSAFIFRAYHALPPLTRKSDGLPVGAVAGFCNLLWSELTTTRSQEAPTHLAVIFDAGSVTFRNAIYPEYKANRPELPEDLRIYCSSDHAVGTKQRNDYTVAGVFALDANDDLYLLSARRGRWAGCWRQCRTPAGHRSTSP